MSRFSNVVDCQRKKCRRFSFLFDFPFYSPARFASIDSLIHSFIHSALFGLCVSRFSSAFASNPNSYPHAPTSPERSCVWKFWVIYQIFKVTFGIVTLVFFCVRWKSKRLFSGVTLLQASHSLKTSRILGGVAKLPCVLPSIKVRRNA